MCGIAGYIAPVEREHDNDLLFAMADSLRHRGPDDCGVWSESGCPVGLAHRRLSIQDLSCHGRQPMRSASGRYTIAFNGEIYNFPSLARELEGLGHRFRGHSDTEVMLASFEQWGVDGSLPRFGGMFAFALWDREEEALFLGRDRAGEKPLYYGWSRGTFLFGSELKALRRHPDWSGGIDHAALHQLLRYTYIPAPLTIHPGIFKLPPGSCLKVDCRGEGRKVSVSQYWSALEVARLGAQEPFEGDEESAVDALEAALRRAVGRQMVSDVPLGAFLSGGYDSSTVAAIMQSLSGKPVRTFTIGFHVPGYNEAEHAKEVARHLGTDHSELYVTDREARDVIPLLPELYDEPFADSSQIPTYLLARLARETVTVSLSGDGGDELFCGYNRYGIVENAWRKMAPIPLPLRRAAAALAHRVPVEVVDRCAALAAPGRSSLNGDRLRRLARLFATASPEEMMELMTGYDLWADSVVPQAAPTPLLAAGLPPEVVPLASRMMLHDFVRYLPDDILVKVDRAAMAVSLETRMPFLDPEVLALAWRLPLGLKRRGDERKWVLRRVLYRHVPAKFVDRGKMGFALPVGPWLRGPLRGWGDELIRGRALTESPFLTREPIERKWREHTSGARDWSYHLWPVLTFLAWYERHKG